MSHLPVRALKILSRILRSPHCKCEGKEDSGWMPPAEPHEASALTILYSDGMVCHPNQSTSPFDVTRAVPRARGLSALHPTALPVPSFCFPCAPLADGTWHGVCGATVLIDASGLEVVGCSSGWAIAAGRGPQGGGEGRGGAGRERERKGSVCRVSRGLLDCRACLAVCGGGVTTGDAHLFDRLGGFSGGVLLDEPLLPASSLTRNTRRRKEEDELL